MAAAQRLNEGAGKLVHGRATGRAVIGFMSGNQGDPDMKCEVFILDPTDLVG